MFFISAFQYAPKASRNNKQLIFPPVFWGWSIPKNKKTTFIVSRIETFFFWRFFFPGSSPSVWKKRSQDLQPWVRRLDPQLVKQLAEELRSPTVEPEIAWRDGQLQELQLLDPWQLGCNFSGWQKALLRTEFIFSEVLETVFLDFPPFWEEESAKKTLFWVPWDVCLFVHFRVEIQKAVDSGHVFDNKAGFTTKTYSNPTKQLITNISSKSPLKLGETEGRGLRNGRRVEATWPAWEHRRCWHGTVAFLVGKL